MPPPSAALQESLIPELRPAMNHTLECVGEDAGASSTGPDPSTPALDHVWTCLRDLLTADTDWVNAQGVVWLYLVLLTAAQHHMRLNAGMLAAGGHRVSGSRESSSICPCNHDQGTEVLDQSMSLHMLVQRQPVVAGRPVALLAMCNPGEHLLWGRAKP